MTQIAIHGVEVPLSLEVGKALRLTDDELFELCARNSELRIERTAQGDLIVMTPAAPESSHRSLAIAAALYDWARRDGTGLAFDSSGGFILPNGAMRAPDASWVRRDRLAGLSAETKKRFLPLCPDFVVEIRSPSDSLAVQQEKLQEYLDSGARLGWLVDPDARRLHVDRPDRPVEVLEDPRSITGDPELPGFTLDLEAVWAPL
ncbi:MAG TPA: Uma2 family endonuclease [Thermoanaerobaculia bacterium]|nr:Uma2 family endonuclease [Thermoanaerobaculia bacterium]HXT51000.1 Uma2 family endonuclease [Thermoanaerobaculia bacterium]